MTGQPAWVTGGSAAIMILIATWSAGRLVASRLRGRAAGADTDALHVLMGISMAGMFEPRLSPVPGAIWQTVFAASAAWFAWQAVRRRHRSVPGDERCAHLAAHAVESAAMVYMLLPAAPWPAGHGPAMTMPGMTGTAGLASRNPAFALILALFLLGYVLWITDGLTARSPAGATGSAHRRAPGLAPRIAALARIAMSAAMGYMLLATL